MNCLIHTVKADAMPSTKTLHQVLAYLARMNCSCAGADIVAMSYVPNTDLPPIGRGLSGWAFTTNQAYSANQASEMQKLLCKPAIVNVLLPFKTDHLKSFLFSSYSAIIISLKMRYHFILLASFVPATTANPSRPDLINPREALAQVITAPPPAPISPKTVPDILAPIRPPDRSPPRLDCDQGYWKACCMYAPDYRGADVINCKWSKSATSALVFIFFIEQSYKF